MNLDQAHRIGYDLVRSHTERFVGYVGELTTDELERPVPGLDWTVGDVVTHLRSVYERYTINRRRARSATDVAVHNAEDITRLDEGVAAAARSMAAQVELMAAAVHRFAPTDVFPFHAGTSITVAGGWGNLLGELHAHGDDIARATGKPFGIASEHLEITWRYAVPVLGGWIRADAADIEESWVLGFPFGDLALSVAGGTLEVGPDPSAQVQARIDIDDTAEWTLGFPYRRRALTDPWMALLASRFGDL